MVFNPAIGAYIFDGSSRNYLFRLRTTGGSTADLNMVNGTQGQLEGTWDWENDDTGRMTWQGENPLFESTAPVGTDLVVNTLEILYQPGPDPYMFNVFTFDPITLASGDRIVFTPIRMAPKQEESWID